MNATDSLDLLPLAAFIGLDWGDTSNAVVLFDPATGKAENSTLVQTPEAVHLWIEQLQERFGSRPVGLAIETSKGGLIQQISNVPWLVIYPIHPATSARYRKAFSPSGAKDDKPDAAVLLDILLHHRHKLRPLTLEDGLTRQLGRMCELRRKSVDKRTQLTNEMRSLLKEYFPQVLRLVGEVLHSPLALDFLERWPDLISLKAARAATVKRFYYQHNVRRPESIQERIDLIAKAKPLTTDEAIIAVSVRHIRRLTEQLRSLQNHILQDEEEIERLFKSHPDASLFKDLPGAGKILAPRLLVGFGADRSRYSDASELLRYSGVAPVKEKSGGRVWIHWRWNAPRFLRQSLIEWAGQTIKYSSWATAYYTQQKKAGKRHWAILRALAFKWIRILWKCWTTRQPYDEARYLAALQKRNSPLSHAA